MFKTYDMVISKEIINNSDLVYGNTDDDYVKVGCIGCILEIIGSQNKDEIKVSEQRTYLVEFENNILAYVKEDQIILKKLKERKDKLNKI